MDLNNEADFRGAIPEDLRAHPTLSPYKGFTELLKSHINLNGILGKARIARPQDNDPPEAWNKFYGELGRPEAPDKYGLQKPADLPEGLNLPEPYLKFLGEAFHKSGLTTKQAQALFSELNGYAVQNFNTDKTTRQTQMQNLQNELELEFGASKPAKLDAAKRAELAFTDEKTKAFLKDSGLEGHPVLTRLFAKIGEKLADPATDGAGGGSNSFANLSPAQAQTEINAKMADEEFMKQYTNQFHPAHKQAVETMTALFGKLSPGNQPSE